MSDRIYLGYCGRCLGAAYVTRVFDRTELNKDIDFAEAWLAKHQVFCRGMNAHKGNPDTVEFYPAEGRTVPLRSYLTALPAVGMATGGPVKAAAATVIAMASAILSGVPQISNSMKRRLNVEAGLPPNAGIS